MGSLLTVASATAQAPSDEVLNELRQSLAAVQSAISELKNGNHDTRLVADVEVFAKGVEWCVRHGEFYPSKKEDQPSAWIGYCRDALKSAHGRMAELRGETHSWTQQPGSSIRGYQSRVDGSIQPYAVSLPAGFNDAPRLHRWPLHVVLHGRGGSRNEVRFFKEHAGKAPQEGQSWIQLDVFGRTDNAYRWSGETDVFEAIADLKRRYRIDDRRITLWGFSMGGAGSWHLGLHHPSVWSSVGPGAGFVDFYQYQKQTTPRPSHEHRALHIYDAVDYAINLQNVPLCTYGGELDAQLAASTTMVELAEKLGVPVKLLVGPGVGHKFHPDSFKEFMAWHLEHAAAGRPATPGRRSIWFVTWTLKYNRCEWLTINELDEQYTATTVSGGIGGDRVVRIKTTNVAALSILRDAGQQVDIDGTTLPLQAAADGLLPEVYYQKTPNGWTVLDYEPSREFQTNPELHKRNNLQGPIDDAFMESFVCVRGTGQPWSDSHQAWADWSLQRFEREFDKWLRGRIRIITPDQVTDEIIADSNLILFGDPGSNPLIARILPALPVEWTRESIKVGSQSWPADGHAVSLIYPNPLNPRRYVVINSGHTMHEADFENSNAWLFPRLGDIAVQQITSPDNPQSPWSEAVKYAELFDSRWQLPAGQ